jgi:hypothetical protein
MAFEVELMEELMEGEEINLAMNSTTAPMVKFTSFLKLKTRLVANSFDRGADRVLKMITSGRDPYAQRSTEWTFIDDNSSTTASSSLSSFDDQENVGVWVWNTSESRNLSVVAETSSDLEVDKVANEMLDSMDDWFKPTVVSLRK